MENIADCNNNCTLPETADPDEELRVENPSPPGHDCGVYDTIPQEDEGWLRLCSRACSPLGWPPSPGIFMVETPGGSNDWSSASSSPKGVAPSPVGSAPRGSRAAIAPIITSSPHSGSRSRPSDCPSWI